MTVPQNVREILREFVNDPGLIIPEAPRGYVFPTIATVRSVDIRGTPNRLDAEYSAANYEVDLDDAGGLSQVLTRLATGTPTQFPFPDAASPKSPYKTPLSLQNQKHVYVIIKLAGKNWQFSYDKAPFSIDLEARLTDKYVHARKVDSLGRIVDPRTPTANCRVAFFVVDASTFWNGTDPYSHGFNLHVDLRYKDHSNQDSFMPLLIDPDVRYPGGSGA